MDNLRAVIIDDEDRARNTLNTLLKEYCQGIEVMAMCSNVPDGVLAINQHRADVVFLDIEMPEYNGFDLPGFFRHLDFEIVFVTAYNDYAIRAFEVSAVDYLLKPVDIEQLKNAVEKVRQKRGLLNMEQRYELMKESYKSDVVTRFALPVGDGLLFVEVNNLAMLEADGAYTKVLLNNGSELLVSKKLRFFEEALTHRPNFYRLHRSYLININHINKYNKGESVVVMDNGKVIPVSRENKAELEALLKKLKVML